MPRFLFTASDANNLMKKLFYSPRYWFVRVLLCLLLKWSLFLCLFYYNLYLPLPSRNVEKEKLFRTFFHFNAWNYKRRHKTHALFLHFHAKLFPCNSCQSFSPIAVDARRFSLLKLRIMGKLSRLVKLIFRVVFREIPERISKWPCRKTRTA